MGVVETRQQLFDAELSGDITERCLMLARELLEVQPEYSVGKGTTQLQ
jgi:hypothetical protein